MYYKYVFIPNAIIGDDHFPQALLSYVFVHTSFFSLFIYCLQLLLAHAYVFYCIFIYPIDLLYYVFNMVLEQDSMINLVE